MLAFSFILPAKSFDGEVALDWSSGICVTHSKKAQPTNEWKITFSLETFLAKINN